MSARDVTWALCALSDLQEVAGRRTLTEAEVAQTRDVMRVLTAPASADRYAVCRNNRGGSVLYHSLTPGKTYRVIPDTVAEMQGMLRIVDDDSEDYLYEADLFELVDPTS